MHYQVKQSYNTKETESFMAYIKISGIRSSYKNPQITYAEFLRAAREIEEELGENSPQESKPDKKAKVASTTVSSSTAPELSKLAEVTLKCSQEQEKSCKLMNELISPPQK